LRIFELKALFLSYSGGQIATDPYPLVSARNSEKRVAETSVFDRLNAFSGRNDISIPDKGAKCSCKGVQIDLKQFG